MLRLDRGAPLLVLARAALVAALVAMVVHGLFFATYEVAGSSMWPTLANGDRVLVLEALPTAPEVGDVVIVEVEGEVLVKRLAAVPGDRIAMLSGAVILNGRTVDEPYPRGDTDIDSFPEYRLASHECFVLGDNRPVSIDSRDFGPVPVDALIGTVVARLSRSGQIAEAEARR